MEETGIIQHLSEENEQLRRRVSMLESEAARFRATLYSIGDAVITTDASGAIVQMNRVARPVRTGGVG